MIVHFRNSSALFFKSSVKHGMIKQTGPEVIKLFMLNSVEHEILNAHKYKNIKKFSFFPDSDKPRMLFFLLINVKMPTTVGILAFMSRKNFMLNWVEHEKSFINSRPGLFWSTSETFSCRDNLITSHCSWIKWTDMPKKQSECPILCASYLTLWRNRTWDADIWEMAF